MKTKLKILILFECSGVSRRAFEARGHDVVSIDLQPADDRADNHYRCDAVQFLEGLRDGRNELTQFDLILMHPPCTALAVSGNRWYGQGMPRHNERKEAVEWTLNLWDLATSVCDRVAMENPVGVLSQTRLGPASQYLQPWQFGEGETKKTGLWLHNLPNVEPTNIVDGRNQRVWKMGPSPDRKKMRSQTYQGMAQAWASQWSQFLVIQAEKKRWDDIQNAAMDGMIAQYGHEIAF